MAASGIHEPLQEMTMRSRNTVSSPVVCQEAYLKDGKSGIQYMRPFAVNPLVNSFSDHATMEETLVPGLQRDESPTRFPIFTEDVSPLIHRTASPSKSDTIPPPVDADIATEQSDTTQHLASSELTLQHPAPEDLINPLDRPTSPEPQNPFTDPSDLQFPASAEQDPSESHYEDAESSPLSRSSSRTLSLQASHHGAADHSDIEDMTSMSDWTEAFDDDTTTDTEGMTDVDSDSDVVSDAESEASWARVRSSRGMGYN